MNGQAEVLSYGGRGFGAKAKRLLQQNIDFDVVISGWRAKVIIASLHLLMYMQRDEKEKQNDKLGTFYTLSRFAGLTLLSPFMAVFWLAVANNRIMHMERFSSNSVQLAFRAKKYF